MSAPAATDPGRTIPVHEPTSWDRTKYKIYGVVLVAIIVGFVALCAAVYSKAFESTETVTLDAERAGLQMYPGNRVQLRGVDVGEVDTVEAVGTGGVRLTLSMDPDQMPNIPANIGVQLNQQTAFGAKTVNLLDPAGPPTGTLRPGARLATDTITVEVNNLFDRLDTVLATARPADVSAILGGLANTLDGRGDELGQTAEELSTYLRRFNGNLPQLQRDFAKGADVANLYADIAPDLLQTLENLRTPSRSLVEQREQLDRFLNQLTRFGAVGNDFFARNADGLVNTAEHLRSITGLLNEYSPQITCFITGMAETNRRFLTQQGNTVPGFVGNTTIEYGQDAYAYPDRRPEVSADGGPNCNGLPYIEGDDVPASLSRAVDGGGEETGGNRITTARDPLVVTLFGPQAALPLTTPPVAPGNAQGDPDGVERPQTPEGGN
jgi:phospholipid/cholesterol/gamma-HCH transport system substrate-binding protein